MCSLWVYDDKNIIFNFHLQFQTTQSITTQIMTSSTRICQLGKTYPQYQWEGVWAPCLSLTASPLLRSPASFPHIPASVLLHHRTRTNTGPPNPTRPIPYSLLGSAHPLPCPRSSDATPRYHPSLMEGPGCCMSATPPSMTTCQKRNCTLHRHSPFSHPSPMPHPCPRQMGVCLLPNT